MPVAETKIGCYSCKTIKYAQEEGLQCAVKTMLIGGHLYLDEYMKDINGGVRASHGVSYIAEIYYKSSQALG